MGALHAGHEALIEAARRKCGVVVVSIFVNPLQFGPNEDYQRYPRALVKDLGICRRHGADIVFNPSVDEMYRTPQLTFAEVTRVSEDLCEGQLRSNYRSDRDLE